jgi:hypothetical protein
VSHTFLASSNLYNFWLFSTLVAGILHKKKNLKDLIELRFEDLTPYPPLHFMERGFILKGSP